MSTVERPAVVRGTRRARRTLERDYARLQAGTMTALRGKLSRAGVQLDASDLEAAYNLAWHALYAKLAQGEEIENPGGFLTQAAFFRAVDEYRARRPDRRADADPEALGVLEPDLDGRLDDRQRLRVFREGLQQRLGEHERRAAVLCYLHGYSRAEAATLLDVPPARMEKLMDRVSKVVRGIVDDLREGSWCDSQRSLMTAYALGVLAPDGPRRALAAQHLETCSGCRSHVRRLRGMGAVVPPIALPWGTVGIDPFQVPALLGGAAPIAGAPSAPSPAGSAVRVPFPGGVPGAFATTGAGALAATAAVVVAVSLGDAGPPAPGPPGGPSPVAGVVVRATGTAGGATQAMTADRDARRAQEVRRARAERVAARRDARTKARRTRLVRARAARSAARRRAAAVRASAPATAPAATPVAAATAPPGSAAPASSSAPAASGPSASRAPATSAPAPPAPAARETTDGAQEFGFEP